jgi:hypothetical protein
VLALLALAAAGGPVGTFVAVADRLRFALRRFSVARVLEFLKKPLLLHVRVGSSASSERASADEGEQESREQAEGAGSSGYRWISHDGRIHCLLYSANYVSVLGKAYLYVSLTLFVIALLWATLTLKENTSWVEVFFWVPSLDFDEPFTRRRYELNISGLLGGWLIALALSALYAIRAPFRIRGAAISQRRMRELEREVLELRTLPLRQQEEDEILAAEAHIGAGTKKVMTQKLMLEQRTRVDAWADAPSRVREHARSGSEDA